MAWIESHQSIRNHRKIIDLAELLGVPQAQVIGHLHCLWWWALDNALDGNLDGITVNTIAIAAGWEEYCNWLECSTWGREELDNFDFVGGLWDVGLIDLPAGWTFANQEHKPGNPKEISEDSDFLPKGTKIHDWYDYASRFIEQRKLNAIEKKTGGKQRMSLLSPEQRSRLGKMAAEKRWADTSQ